MRLQHGTEAVSQHCRDLEAQACARDIDSPHSKSVAGQPDHPEVETRSHSSSEVVTASDCIEVHDTIDFEWDVVEDMSGWDRADMSSVLLVKAVVYRWSLYSRAAD